MVSGGRSASEARKGIEQYFSSGGRATALVVATSTSALGVHAGVISSGRSIPDDVSRSEEHTSELQSRGHLVCRLLLEKKKKRPVTPRGNQSRTEEHASRMSGYGRDRG